MLGSIVIRQQKTPSETQKAENNVKIRRRASLRAELDNHMCSDREARKVPHTILQNDKVLQLFFCSDQCLALEEKQDKGGEEQDKQDAPS